MLTFQPEFDIIHDPYVDGVVASYSSIVGYATFELRVIFLSGEEVLYSAKLLGEGAILLI